MLLITNKTTLEEFVGAKSLCIKDPVTNLLRRVFIKDTMSGAAKFIHAMYHVNEEPIKYLRFNSGCNGNNIVVDKAEVILGIIKEGNFVFDY